jgi:hypothetical protein
MGRYYSGTISGKFWFGVQSSDDPSYFGVEPSQQMCYRACYCVADYDASPSSFCENCFTSRADHVAAVASDEGIVNEQLTSTNQLVAKLCLNRLKLEGLSAVVARTPSYSDLSPPHFAFAVVDMMMNCAMQPQAERILELVGRGDVEEEVGSLLQEANEIYYYFDAELHKEQVKEVLLGLEAEIRERGIDVKDLKQTFDLETNFAYEIDWKVLEKGKGGGGDADRDLALQKLVARWCLGSQILYCFESNNDFCSITCEL